VAGLGLVIELGFPDGRTNLPGYNAISLLIY
jgi:hypothetical protein